MQETVNKRSFSRRKVSAEFNLIVSGETLSAIVTDISLEGLGILVKGRKELNASVLDLKIRDMDLDAMCRVIWEREDEYGLRAGVLRVGQLEGALSRYKYSDLIAGIRRSKKMGVLHIEADSWKRQIFFRDGEMVFSSSDREHEQIGTILLAEGKILPHQYQNSLLVAGKTGRSQGAILAEMRYITPQELVQATHQRVESVIMNLCAVEDAKFSFSEEALPRSEIVMLKLNANDLLYRGAKRVQNPENFMSRYLDRGAHMFISAEAPLILNRMILDDRDREVLKLLSNNMSFKELLLISPFKEEDTLKSIYSLTNAQLIELEDAEEKTGDRKSDQEDTGLSPELSERIERLYLEHKNLGYHGILELSPNFSASDIKHAYHKMAKEFHPDRYLHINSPSLKEKLNVIFAYISEAYRQLSKAGGSSQTDQTSAPQQPEPPPMNKKNMAFMKYRQGRDALADHDMQNAMTLLGQAVYLDESVADYHFYYGIALLKSNRVKEAEGSIRKALQRSPYNVDYMAELGFIYLKLGFLIRARNTFDKALRLNPSHTHAAEGLRQVKEAEKR